MVYFVVGGKYEDTSFRALREPAPVSGPFDTYADAYVSWRELAMRTVDDAHVRFQIVATIEQPPRDSLRPSSADLPGPLRRD